jgi:hypothetical protein
VLTICDAADDVAGFTEPAGPDDPDDWDGPGVDDDSSRRMSLALNTFEPVPEAALTAAVPTPTTTMAAALHSMTLIQRFLMPPTMSTALLSRR